MKTQILLCSLTALLMNFGQSHGQTDGQSGDTCPVDFEDVLSDHGLCLLLVKNRVTWYEARDQCLAHDSELVYVDSMSMATKLQTMIQGRLQSYWIGLNDILEENAYYWNDGTPLTWTHWGNSAAYPQPNDQSHGQNCNIGDTRDAMLVKNTWQDKPCTGTESEGYICQWRPENGLKMRRFKERPDLSIMEINVEVTSSIPGGSVTSCAAHCVSRSGCDGFFYKTAGCDLLMLTDQTKTLPDGRVFVAAGTGEPQSYGEPLVAGTDDRHDPTHF